jgi:hypothetical protein
MQPCCTSSFIAPVLLSPLIVVGHDVGEIVIKGLAHRYAGCRLWSG